MTHETDPSALVQLMQNHVPELTAFVLSIFGGVWAMVRAIVNRFVKKHDQLEERVTHLETTTVTEDTFNQTVSSLRSEINRTRTEIREDLKDIKSDVNRSLDRILEATKK